MPDPFKKKKKDEEQKRLTDTGTGARKTVTPSIQKPKTITPSVQKPGVTKKATVSQPVKRATDTGTDTKARRQTRIEEAKQVSREAKEKLRQQNSGTQQTTETRRQAESSVRFAEDYAKSGQRSAYRDYVAKAKLGQHSRAVEERERQELIAQQRRKDRLLDWDLESAQKDREQMRYDAEKAKYGIHQLTNQMNSAAAAGDQAAVLRLNTQIQALREQVDRYAQFDRDYQEARSLQYYQKGGETLDHIKEADAAVWSHIDTIAHGSADWSFKHAVDAGSDIGAEKMDAAKIRAEDDAIKQAKEALRKTGYKEKDIEQLVDYRVRQLNEERTLNMIAQAQQLAKTDPFGASAASVGTNLMGGLGFLDAVAQQLTNPDRPLDYNTKAQAPSLMTNTVRGQVSQDLVDKYGKKGAVYSFLYQTGMSMADSSVNMMLGAAGMPEALGLSIMAGSAATSSMKEAHDRGLSDGEALTIGLIAGSAEYITERVELKSLMEILDKSGADKKLATSALRGFLKQANEEGKEEVASDIINFVADALVSGDRSQFNERIHTYQIQGFSYEEAMQKAVLDQVKDTALSYAGGFLSGGVMGGAAAAGSNIVNRGVETISLGGSLGLPLDNPVHVAANAYRGAQAIVQQSVENRVQNGQSQELTDGEQAFLAAARQTMIDAYADAPSEDKARVKDAAKTARALLHAEKQGAKQETKARKADIAAEVDEALAALSSKSKQTKESTVYSENTTLQQAAEWTASGKQANAAKAVNAVMRSEDAQSALGLSFSEDMDNTAKRTQINKALKALVQEGGIQQQAAQEEATTPTHTELLQERVPYETFRQNYLASAESVPDLDTSEETIRERYEEYLNNIFIDGAGTVWNPATFAQRYRETVNPNASDEEVQNLFQLTKEAADKALAEKLTKAYNQGKQIDKEGKTNGQKDETGSVESEAGDPNIPDTTNDAGDTGRAATSGDRDHGLPLRRVGGGDGGKADEQAPGRGTRRGSTKNRRESAETGRSRQSLAKENREAGRPDDVRSGTLGPDQDAHQGSTGRTGVKKKSANHAEAERVRALNLPVKEVSIPGGAQPLLEVERDNVPKEFHSLYADAERMGAKLRFMLGDFLRPDTKNPARTKRHQAFYDVTNRTIWVSLDNEKVSAKIRFHHELGHHALEVCRHLWDDTLMALEEKGNPYDLLGQMAKDIYGKKNDGHDTDYYIEELLCDCFAGFCRDGLNTEKFLKIRKTLLPLFQQRMGDYAENLKKADTNIKGFDFDDVPDWAYDEDEGDYEYDEEDIYEDVPPEDKQEDVKNGLWEETGDDEANADYYADSGRGSESPSGLSPKDVIYDPGRMAYYDKKTGRRVFYDADSTQTFFYDEFGAAFEGAEEPGPLEEIEKEKLPDLNAPPGYKDSDTAVADLQPTDTNSKAFKKWFNDPTETRELSIGKRGKKPRSLFHGSVVAGFTTFLLSRNSSSVAGGIYLTDNVETAGVYAKTRGGEQQAREFKPRVAKSWSEAEHYTRMDLGMRLEEDDDGYTLYAYNEKTGLFEERGTFPANESGLRAFNDAYGEAHNGVETPGVYQLYGTSDNALVIDAHGRDWEHVLYDPVGRSIDDNPDTQPGKWWRTDDVVDRAFASGYDCVIIKNVNDGAGPLNNDYIFKDPGQIKSVYNTGTWDRENHDIRYFTEDEMSEAENNYQVLYDSDTGEFFFDGRIYKDVDEFILAAEEFEDDYEPDELEKIKASITALGFDVNQFFPNDTLAARTDTHKVVKETGVKTGVRKKGQVKPGFSEDYGTGRKRGLDSKLVVYDPSYDDGKHSTPFFEASTGKEVYYDTRNKTFRYDEVREVLQAEDPKLLATLLAGDHFADFEQDKYRDWTDDVKTPDGIERRGLSYAEKQQLVRQNIRKAGMSAYSENFSKWFNDPTESKELTTESGMPRVLYHGSTIAGFTKFVKNKLRRRGIFATTDFRTSDAYGDGPEFIPLELTSWRQAEAYLRSELNLHLFENRALGVYELFSGADPKTGELTRLRSYPATDEGLRELNDTYGEEYTKNNVGMPGYYRLYGTSDKAFVLNLGEGDIWTAILFNPTGLTANPKAKHSVTLADYWDTDDLADFLFSQGYDCLIVKGVADGNDYDNTDYIFRDPGQLKSVYNTGTWDRNNPDFRYFTDDDEEILPPGYTFDEQVDLTLADALDNHLLALVDHRGKAKRSAVYVSFETPNILAEIGLSDQPMLMTQQHLRDANHPRVEKADGTPLPGYEHFHGITPEKLKKLPELLQKPALLIKAPGRHAGDVIVVTTEKDYRGRQIIVTIHPDGNAVYDGVRGPANFITTMYGYGKQKGDIKGMIELAAKQGRVMYAHKNRSQEIMASGGRSQQTSAASALAKGGFRTPPPTPNQGSKHTPGASAHNNRAFWSLDFDTIIQGVDNPVKNPPLRKFFSEDSQDASTPDSFESLVRQAQEAYARIQSEGVEPVTARKLGSVAQVDNDIAAWLIYRRRYGAIEQTGKNYRDVEVPRSIDGKKKVSKTTSTVMGAEVTGDARLKQIASAVVDGKLSHFPISDKIAGNRARAKIQKLGFQEARANWTKEISEGKVNKDLVAMGATLLNNAGNSDATGAEYVGILTDYADLLRHAGQALQAAKILKKLSPEARLYTAQRQVDRINEELIKRGFDPTRYPNVKIDQALIDEFNQAKTEEERNKVMEKIAQNIADQIPPTFIDKFTAWRYLAMLGNLKTQVRNVFGNAFMQPMRMLKADVAGLTEALIQGLGGNIDRTTSVLRDSETFRYAFEDFKSVRDIILTGGKFDDNKRFAKEIEDRRRIFKSKLLEGYRHATNWAMDQGDAIFCSFTYADALARFMKANHTTWSQASEELRDKGRAVAIKEAAEATYRDDNAFSNFITKLRVRNPDNAVKKAASVALEGVLPFRKTPANILARTVEYSPVGLLYSGYKAAVKAAGKDNVTGTDIVNQMAKGLTGTGLLALGFALTSMGLLVGKAPDDDKEKDQWKREGHQAYALEILGHSYTLDWMAPVCVPLFLGANLQEAMLAEGLSLDSALSALNTISDPVLEMSMLQGIQSLIDNAANYGDDSALVRLTANAMWSYATQVVPTWLGQANRIIKGKRMQTYTDKNKAMPGDWQYALGKLSAKVPFTSYAQILYTDAWGRTHDNADTPTINVVQQLVSPGYISKLETSDMEKELVRLKRATGDSSVLISNAQHSISYTKTDKNGNKQEVKKELTGTEYLTYNMTRGQTAYRVMTELVNSAAYKAMSDSDKAAAVKRVYDYATQVGKAKTVPEYEPDGWVRKAQDADKDLGLSEQEFITAYLKYGGNMFSDSSYDKLKTAVQAGVSVDNYAKMRTNIDADDNGSVSQAEAKAYLDRTDFTRQQKSILWQLLNKRWKNNPYA